MVLICFYHQLYQCLFAQFRCSDCQGQSGALVHHTKKYHIARTVVEVPFSSCCTMYLGHCQDGVLLFVFSGVADEEKNERPEFMSMSKNVQQEAFGGINVYVVRFGGVMRAFRKLTAYFQFA